MPSVCHPFMIVGICSSNFWPLFKKISIHSNGCCYSCEINFHPSEWLRLSVRKNLRPLKQLGLSVWKKWSSVRKKSAAVQTADVIHLKETALLRTANVSHFGNSIQLFKQLLLSVHTKLISRSVGQQYMMGFKFPNRWDYLFRRNFIQLSEWLCSFETKSQPI